MRHASVQKVSSVHHTLSASRNVMQIQIVLRDVRSAMKESVLILVMGNVVKTLNVSIVKLSHQFVHVFRLLLAMQILAVDMSARVTVNVARTSIATTLNVKNHVFNVAKALRVSQYLITLQFVSVHLATKVRPTPNVVQNA